MDQGGLLLHYLAYLELTLLKICFFLSSPSLIPASLFVLLLVVAQSLCFPFYVQSLDSYFINPTLFALGRLEELMIISIVLYAMFSLAWVQSRFLPCLISYFGSSYLLISALLALAPYAAEAFHAPMMLFIWALLWMTAIKAHILKAALSLHLSGALMCVFFIEAWVRVGNYFFLGSHHDLLVILYKSILLIG